MEWFPRFLEKLAETCNVAESCRAASISRQVAYEHRGRNPEFASAWDDALDDGTDALELEARRRAKDGYDKPVFYQGVECGTVREYSDTLMILLLKAHRPEKYREAFDVQKLAAAIIAAQGATQPVARTDPGTSSD